MKTTKVRERGKKEEGRYGRKDRRKGKKRRKKDER